MNEMANAWAGPQTPLEFAPKTNGSAKKWP